MKIIFIKIKNNHNRLRSDEIIGECQHLPKVGSQFVMFSDPIDENATVRIVSTSVVVSVEVVNEKTYRIETESGSIYEIQVLSERQQ